ncbi:TPA: DDE-type integrase/transposase/recombinase [Pseudomonas aeruginosa]|nr:DDE-type integrase/transposase/recombinase [Pseudomonas aeruginosa]HEP8840818.1 DDE-type integrase/transposase/recombinase [Pseudomonas aeruginosa]HEP8849399.1 DDE-type integrase/transposase/recombinase [Pseudomonas aeruginosa]
MLKAIDQRFGSELPASPEQWPSDDGSTYTAEQIRAFARQIGLLPLTTPECSPQNNGMAESIVKTIKHDHIRHMPKPDSTKTLRNLAIAFEHYIEEHPHSTLNYPLTPGVQAPGRGTDLTGGSVSDLIGQAQSEC